MVKDLLARTQTAKQPAATTLQTVASSKAAAEAASEDADEPQRADKANETDDHTDDLSRSHDASAPEGNHSVADIVVDRPSYIEMERHASASTLSDTPVHDGRMVDVCPPPPSRLLHPPR